MKYILFSALCLSGCMSNQPQQFKETPDCMTYCDMMTAPMLPAAIDRLMQACDISLK